MAYLPNRRGDGRREGVSKVLIRNITLRHMASHYITVEVWMHTAGLGRGQDDARSDAPTAARKHLTPAVVVHGVDDRAEREPLKLPAEHRVIDDVEQHRRYCAIQDLQPPSRAHHVAATTTARLNPSPPCVNSSGAACVPARGARALPACTQAPGPLLPLLL